MPELAVETVPIGRLFCNPANPRHNEEAVPCVADSIRRFGWQQPLVAKRSGEVIAGNTRLKAAQTLGCAEVPVVWFEGPDVEAVAFSIADNRTAEFATWDEPALAKLLEELRAEDALEGIGYSDSDIDGLLKQLEADLEPEPLDDPGPGEVPERPVTRSGDLWVLGDHRLLCGDSTSEDDMARLMAGETAVLLATDPPYLVGYDGSNHPAEHHKKAGRQTTKAGEEVGNKHWDQYIDPQTGVAFFTDFLRVALAHSIDRVPIYQWHASKRQALVEQAWEANGLLVHQTIIWAKTRGVLTRSMFLWAHEPCFFGWPKGRMPPKERRPPPSERTVWDIPGDEFQDGSHPTVKPLAIFERPIQYHTLQGELVLEPFSGSGTQIIAAERLHRRCRAMELSPAFVDVAIRRWQKASGKVATLEATGQTFEELETERCSTG